MRVAQFPLKIQMYLLGRYCPQISFFFSLLCRLVLYRWNKYSKMGCDPSLRPKQQCIICMHFQINVKKVNVFVKHCVCNYLLGLVFLQLWSASSAIYCSRVEKKAITTTTTNFQIISWCIRNWEISLSSVLREMFAQGGSHSSLHSLTQLTALGLLLRTNQ